MENQLFTNEALAYQQNELEQANFNKQSDVMPNALFTDEALAYEKDILARANFGIPQSSIPRSYLPRQEQITEDFVKEIDSTLTSRMLDAHVPKEFIKLGLNLRKDKKLTEKEEQEYKEFLKQFSSYSINEEQEKFFKDVFLTQGLIDQYRKTKTQTVRDMFYDIDKLSTLSAEDFQLLDTLRDIDEGQNDDLAPSTVGRYYSSTDEYLKLNRQLVDGKITPEQYESSLLGYQRLYSRQDDSSFWQGMVSLVPSTVRAVIDNPIASATTAATAFFTGGKSIQYGLAWVMGEQGYTNSLAEIAWQKYNNAKAKGENISFEQAKDDAFGYAVSIGALNSVAAMLNIKFALPGTIKGIEAIANYGISNAGAAAIKAKGIQTTIMESLKASFSDFASIFANNAATMLGEEMVRQQAANDLTGDNKNIIGAGVKSVFDSLDVLAGSSLLFAVPGMAGHATHAAISIKNLKANTDGTIRRAELNALMKDNPDLENGLKETNNRDVYLDAAEVKQALQENGYNPENLGPHFKNIEEKIANGEDIVISEVEYAKFFTGNELGNILEKHTRTSKDGRSMSDIAKDLENFNTKTESIKKQQQQEQAVKQKQRQKELKEIQGKITQDLKLSGIANKNIEPVTKLVGSVLSTFADRLGISVTEVYEKIPVKFKRLETIIDSDNPEFNTLGQFEKDAFVISVRDSNDIPSVIHEVGHYILESFLVLQQNHPELKASYDKFAEWAGVGNNWSKVKESERFKIHENFVYTLQQMMLNPTKHDMLTAGLFNMFTDIMKKAYGDDAMLMNKEYKNRFNSNLPPVDEPFKQFIRTLIYKDIESDQANADYPMTSIFEGAKDISDEDIKKAEAQWKEGEEIARAENKKQTLDMKSVILSAGDKIKNFSKEKVAEFKRIYNKRFESVKKDILEKRATLDEQVINYRKKYHLKENLLKNHKINRGYAKQVFSKEQMELLEKAGLLSNKGVKDDTQIVSLLEAYNKNQTFEQSLQELIDLPKLNDFIKEKVLADMDNETLNHILIDAEYDLTSKHVNKVRLKAVQDEGAMLDKIAKGLFGKSLKQAKSLDEFKSQVKNNIDNMKMSDANPRSFLNQAKRSRYLATKAIRDANKTTDINEKKKFYMEAVKHNINEQMALEKLIHSVGRRKALDKKLVTLKQFYKKSHKNYDGNILAIGNHLLIAVGLKQGIEKIPMQYETLIRLAPEMKPIYEKYMNTNITEKNINDMTFKEVTTLVNALESIKKEALESRTLELGENTETKADVVKEMQEVLDTKPTIKKSVVDEDGAGTAFSKQRGFFDRLKNTFLEYTVKMETYLKTLDGGENGVFHRTIYQPMRNALTQFQLKSNDIYRRQQKIINSIDHGNWKEYKTNLKITDGDKTSYLTFGKKGGKYDGQARVDVLGFLLHLGNESNLKKLAKGYGWDVKEVKQFLAKAIEDGFIDKKMLDAAQQIWDIYAELNDKSQKVHKALNGKFYEEVQNTKIVTPFGEYKGGYVPLISNKFIENVVRPTEIDNVLNNAIADFNDGFTKTRTEALVKVSLDVEDLMGGVTTMLKYNELVLPAKEVLSIIDTKTIQESLAQKAPNAHDFITDWVQRTMQVKQSVVTGEWGRALNTLTSKVGKTIMFANFTNVLQGYTNLIVATVKKDINPIYLFKHATNGFTRDEIMAKSDFMKLRFESDQVLSTEIVDSIIVGNNKVKKFNRFIDKNAYFFQKIAQNQIDKIVWGSAYESYKNKHIGKYDEATLEEMAVNYADSTIRTTQGSFDVSDVAKIEAGSPLVKALNQFCGYFLTLGNLLTSETKMAKSELKGLKLAQRYATIQLLVGIVPAIVGELIAKTAAGDITKEDEDPDRIWNDKVDMLVGSVLRTYSSMIPFAGRFGVYLTQKLAGRDYYNDSVFNVPAITMTGAAYRSLETMIKSLFDDSVEVKGRHINDAMTILGLINPMGGALGKRAAYLYDVAQGNIDTNGAYDFFRGLFVGKASDEQKGN